MIIDFFVNDFLHVRIVLRKRNNGSDMLRLYSEAKADLLQFSGTCRILSAGHSGSEVVRDADNDVGMSIHGIQKSGHTAVGECRVTYHGYCRPYT